eukprot:scaffold163920_cov32-Attheya_sp.AAC.2
MTSPKPWEPSQVLLQEVRANRFANKVYDEDAPFLRQISPCLTNLSEVLTKRANYSQVSMVETEIDDVPARRTFISTERYTKITADSLAERFCIGTERAKQTIRRYRADRRFEVKRLNTKFATDTAYAKVKSIRGNIGSQVYTHKSGFQKPCQVYTHKSGFQKPYPVQKADGDTIGYTLSEFISDFGAPDQLTYDGAAVQVGSKTRFMDLIRRYEIKYHVSAPRRPNENPAEGGIRELKKRWYRIMTKKNVPKQLWDFGFDW